jgi:acyl carrier protein
MEFSEKVCMIIRDVLSLEDDVYPDELLVDDLNFTRDSAIDCFFRLKEEYKDITADEKDIEKLETVQDAIDYFEKQIKG